MLCQCNTVHGCWYAQSPMKLTDMLQMYTKSACIHVLFSKQWAWRNSWNSDFNTGIVMTSLAGNICVKYALHAWKVTLGMKYSTCIGGIMSVIESDHRMHSAFRLARLRISGRARLHLVQIDTVSCYYKVNTLAGKLLAQCESIISAPLQCSGMYSASVQIGGQRDEDCARKGLR